MLAGGWQASAKRKMIRRGVALRDDAKRVDVQRPWPRDRAAEAVGGV